MDLPGNFQTQRGFFTLARLESSLRDHDRQFFDMALVSILSFQFHPGNHIDQTDPAAVDAAVRNATYVASVALRSRSEFLDSLVKEP